MVGCITFHAIQRLGERRNCVHLIRHINKIRRWGLPDDGEIVHKGFRYVTRGGVLITVIPDKESIKKYKDKIRRKNETTK